MNTYKIENDCDFGFPNNVYEEMYNDDFSLTIVKVFKNRKHLDDYIRASNKAIEMGINLRTYDKDSSKVKRITEIQKLNNGRSE